MEMGQQVLNKDSNEVKRFIEVMEGISKMLNANSLIYRPILDGNRYITEQELSKALKITKRTLIEYRMNGKLPYYKIGGKILYKGKHSKKCTFYTLRFGCSFAAVNTIKPQLL